VLLLFRVLTLESRTSSLLSLCDVLTVSLPSSPCCCSHCRYLLFLSLGFQFGARVAASTCYVLTLYSAKLLIIPHRIIRSGYTGRWWVYQRCICCIKCNNIWYSKEGTGQGRSPPRPLLAVPNVTAHPSTASVQSPYGVLLYSGPLLCDFNVLTKGLRYSLPLIMLWALWPWSILELEGFWQIEGKTRTGSQKLSHILVSLCRSFISPAGTADQLPQHFKFGQGRV